jgi:tetratricopeptide (TPR) repeat protein
MKAAAKLLDSQGAPLVEFVSVHEIASMLHGINFAGLDSASASIFAEQMADSLRIAGDLAPALLQYKFAVQRCQVRRLDRIPRLLRKMAHIERCRARYPRAMGYLVEAQARLARNPNPAELAEVLREMALVEQAQGDVPNAAAHLNEAIDLATEASDSGALVRGLLALGSLEAQRGQKERSLDYKLEGLRTAERSGNVTEMARGNIAVGTAQIELGRLHESLGYYDKGLQLARLVGNLRLIAYATTNRASTLLDLGRYEEATAPLEEAKRLLELLEERGNQALLSVCEGQREMGLGHWTRAQRIWTQGLKALKDLGAPYDLARALLQIGGFHIDHGELVAGRAYLEEARGIALELGNEALVREIGARLAGPEAREARPKEELSRDG